MTRRKVAAIAMGLVVLCVVLRAGSELAMMREVGPDAQMAIWQMFMIATVGLWTLGGALAAGLLVALWPHRWTTAAGLVLLLAWCAAITHASWAYDEARQALADAKNRSTPPARLSELAHFAGIQSGYELDNRLAANPHTPPETLRELAQRDQLGTRMLLAKNPHTPVDLLDQLRAAKP